MFYHFDHQVALCFLDVILVFFCLVRQLRLLSNNAGNWAAIVEGGSRTLLLAAKQFCTVVRMSRIIRKQLITGHMMGSLPVKRKKKCINNKNC